MRNVWTIIKKEFARFFKDRRMVLTIILPGLLIFILYSILGGFITDMAKTPQNVKYTAYIENKPKDEKLLTYLSAVLNEKSDITAQQATDGVKNGDIDLYIVFPENFDEVLKNKPDETPDVKIYYNSSVDSSVNGYAAILGILEGFKNPAFSVNLSGNFDLAEKKERTGRLLASIMPMLMLALLVSGCVGITTEAIAGEKERGTMATMLITPIKRWQLALGKILSLSCFALLSGISSFLGTILSLPKMMAGIAVGEFEIGYGFGDYAMIFGLIISLTLVIVSAFSVLSAYAKSVKEAGALITPLMMLLIVLGIAALVFPNPAVGLYAVPVLGSTLALSAIMTFSLPPLGFVLSIISNFVLAALLVVALSFMFRSERIMFNK